MSLCKLPEELLAYIATFADATSILHLTQTSRKLRAVCYDAVAIRKALRRWYSETWTSDTLDFEALSLRAGQDASIWLRYAVANERATLFGQKECPLESPERFMKWLPALCAVKHDFMQHECWKRFLRDPLGQSSTQFVCLAAAVLATSDIMAPVSKSLRMQEDPYFSRDDSRKAYFWALAALALDMRTNLRVRMAVWPFNTAAQMPYIELPRLHQIPLRPLNGSYSLPVPFANDRTGVWEDWYYQHCSAMATAEYLCSGEWVGYYSYAGWSQQPQWTDPPMSNIKFSMNPNLQATAGFNIDNEMMSVAPTTHDKILLQATDAVDGVDRFNLICDVRLDPKECEVRFYARKQYRNSITNWDWDCRLTPFGIHGFWGKGKRNGMVWMWKKEWVNASAWTPTKPEVTQLLSSEGVTYH